jgi:hypothetical protein
MRIEKSDPSISTKTFAEGSAFDERLLGLNSRARRRTSAVPKIEEGQG